MNTRWLVASRVVVRFDSCNLRHETVATCGILLRCVAEFAANSRSGAESQPIARLARSLVIRWWISERAGLEAVEDPVARFDGLAAISPPPSPVDDGPLRRRSRSPRIQYPTLDAPYSACSRVKPSNSSCSMSPLLENEVNSR